MLKFLTRIFYQNKIYTTEKNLFYKLYKWKCGLYTLLALRRVLTILTLSFIGIIWLIFISPRIYALAFVDIALILAFLELKETKKVIQFNTCGASTPSQIRTLRMAELIQRFVSLHGKALGKKEWKKIKQHDIGLYNDLLSDECEHCCYFYSLEIALIIKDSTLIWGAIEEPLEDGHNYYAHAVILRNGYIYDSNMHMSEKYSDFCKLYNFKTYKQWKYNEYSIKNFRDSQREEFRKWCQENNVSGYERF